jgi:multidrug resistance efflux pump
MRIRIMNRIKSKRKIKSKMGYSPNPALAPALHHLPTLNLHLNLNPALLSASIGRAFIAFILFLCNPAPAEEIRIPSALVKLIDQLDIPAREPGSLVQLDVQEGTKVTPGALLARIDDTAAGFAEERAKVELQIATQNAASDVAVRSAERASQAANLELKRAEEARQRLRDVVTENEIEKLRLAADQAKLAIEKAQQERAVAQLQRDLKRVEAEFAQANVARRQATAPFPGVVVQVYKHVGDWAEPGEKLLRVVRLDRLRVEAFLDAAQAVPGLEGQPVTLLVDLPGKRSAAFPGKLTFVSPEIDPFNKSLRVLAEIDNPTLQLQPGLRGTIVIRP